MLIAIKILLLIFPPAVQKYVAPRPTCLLENIVHFIYKYLTCLVLRLGRRAAPVWFRPAIYLLVLRPVIAVLGRLDPSSSTANDLPHPITVEGGTWWYGHKYLPWSGKNLHPYFSASRDGKMIRQALVKSGGSCAFLTSAHFRAAILQISEAGLRIISGDRASDRELSSGAWLAPNGQEQFRNGFVVIQRNSKNYCHFITEILPSILAWEASLPDCCTLITAEGSFVEPLLRLIGFRGNLIQLKSPSVALAKNIKVIRLLPAGFFHRELLREIVHRAHSNAACSSIPTQSVVVLLRAEHETRRLGNEAEVINIIMALFPGVDIFYPGDASVDEQVARMANARIVIATHGAHATNMIWATRMMHFIEISYFGDRRRCFQEFAKGLGASPYMVRSTARVDGDQYATNDCDLTELKEVMTFIANLAT